MANSSKHVHMDPRRVLPAYKEWEGMHNLMWFYMIVHKEKQETQFKK